ncbi:hypothetical protein HBE96_21915 [Clostridium sp. P21]|uniref:Flagellin n=1 Tax=Clostridium muellerianum TaxID=2716538 RepID=A0A7Y0EKM5_9CLOT|nr:flagellin [Clostridium muellerianum]NMM65244.1 hypothetical protein [Clostridium muellerianum]
MIIAHNINALNANNRLKKNMENTSKAMGRLSSGLRIEKASDDSAGLAISEKMRGQIRGLEMASRNIQDGVSLVQTADGGLGEILDPALQRMRELALQASNGTLTDEDRENLQAEFEQMGNLVDNIANNTEFNGIKLLASQQVSSITNNTLSKPALKNIDWSYVNDGNNFTAKDIAYDGTGKYVAIGVSGGVNQIMYSSDAVNWNTSAYNPLPSDVIYGNGVFVATGAFSGHFGTDGGIIYSTDGVNWSNSINTSPPIDLKCFGTTTNSITFDGSKFVATGYSSDEGLWKTLTSTNGVDWSVYSNPDKIDCIAFGGGKYVGQGYGKIYTSTDGINWTCHNSTGAIGYSEDAVLCEGGRHFVVGEANGRILESNDGVNWNTSNVSNDSTKFTSIAYDGNQYLAIGNTGIGGKTVIYNSDDGVNWSLQKELSANGSIGTSKIIWDGKEFVAADKDGFSLGIPEYENASSSSKNDSQPLTISLQVGANCGDTMGITLCDVRTSSIGISAINIKTRDNAEDAISSIDKAMAIVSSHRSRMGAYQNALGHTLNNVESYNLNLTSSESRIRDADMAKEMINVVNGNVLLQATESILSQANQQSQRILQLLKE